MALNAHEAAYPLGSSGSARRWKYDVFLSFRGQDTRKGFTDHLYCALQRNGIIAFRDDEELERGHFIKPSLLQAIEESRSAIVVLSPNYASSTWCLDELQKIIHLKEESSLQVFPIFYDVDPSDVKKQKESFEEAFERHEEKDKMKAQGWRNALEKVATIAGWDSKDWHEAKLIETVVEEVWSKLYDELPFDSEILVGTESKLAELDSFIANGMGGVQFVGIWGTGGLGKTTLARAFYERMHKNFDGHCFLHNVREVSKTDGLISLQRKLLSSLHKRSIDVSDCYEGRKLIKNMSCNRKVLLVLDDVSEISQLENLARKQGWFGEGSVILVTTRDKHVLSSYDVSAQYDMKFLSDDESFELFHQNAFKGNKPNKDFMELSRTVIQYAKGLPLVLKVLGSFLCGKSILEWKDAIAKFRKVLSNDVLKILQVSFHGLDDDEKTIFLDIACFFNGKQKDYVIQMLKNLDLHPIVGIKVLIDKSLVIDDEGILWVHDILQEMGKNIVIQESPNDVGKRSRIWTLEDANFVLEGKEGSGAIRGIILRLDQECASYWDPKAFSKMRNLKLLIITSWSHDPHCFLNLPYGLECFSSALKVLQWNGFCLDDLPSHGSHVELIDLKMKHSPSKQLCKGSQAFGRLKFMDLSYSRYLIKTPNFDEIPDLQNLVLLGCINLVEVHPTLGHHQNLVMVNLRGCKNLKTLPTKFEMKCLETLILSGCLQIRRLPEFGKSMNCLSKLDVEETSITKLPQSLVNLCQLVVLNLRNCKNLVCLPNVMHCLKSIKILNISGCPKLSRLPENLNENVALEQIDASGTAIKEVPSSILLLKNLRSLSFSGCSGQAQSSSLNFSSILSRFFLLTRPSISTGLLLPPSLLGLSNLMNLNLSYCNLSDESLPNDMNTLSSLEWLDLRGNNFVNLPVAFISNLLKLWFLQLSHCPRLQSIPRLPSNVATVRAIDCPSMKYRFDSQQLRKIFEGFEYQEGLSSRRPFFMNIGGSEVPSWFHNQNCFCDDALHRQPNVSFITDIEDHHHSSKQLGITVCLLMEGHYGASASYDEAYPSSAWVWWICRNVGDETPNVDYGFEINKHHNDRNQLVLFFFPCVVKKGRQISFHVDYSRTEAHFEIKKCGWRVLCKEDIEAWQRTRGEGCSGSNNNDSDNYHNHDELGETEVTGDCLSNSQSINGSEKEDGQSNVAVDIQMPLTKRRKL